MIEAIEQRKAYSYLRFSCPEQAKGDSFRRQSSLAIEYAQNHNLALDENLTFYDLGISAYHGLNAETGQLGALLEAVKCGLIPQNSVILVESLDRISRQAARKALRAIENILETGVSVVTLGDGREYTIEGLDNDPFSLLMALLTFIRANEESATKSRRLSAAWVAKRQRAKEHPLTSRLPGWLRLSEDKDRIELVPEQVLIIKRIFREALEGRGLLTIMRQLNVDKVPQSGAGGRPGTMWYTGSVGKILKNSAVLGIMSPYRRIYKDGKCQRVALPQIHDYFPPIISKEDFDRLQNLRCTPRSEEAKNRAAAPIRNILAGLAFCSLCGDRMSLVSKSERGHYLVCNAAYSKVRCHYISIRYHEVEASVLKRLKNAFDCISVPTTIAIDKRVSDVRRLLNDAELNRPDLNRSLRSLIDKVIICPVVGSLRFDFKYGEKVILENAFTTISNGERRIGRGKVQFGNHPSQLKFVFNRKITSTDAIRITPYRRQKALDTQRSGCVRRQIAMDYTSNA